MENFIIYIVKASGLIALFFTAYHIFLKKETFFNSNRWFLLAGLLTSAVLPLVGYTKTIWVDPVPQQAYNEMELGALLQQAHLQAQAAPTRVNWFDVAAGIYLAGVIFFLIRFAIDIASLRRILKSNPIIKNGRFLLVDSSSVKSPFSFFNYIVYNSAALLPEELESILTHEKVHSSQKHSLDMVLSQLFCVAFWCNPFAWGYKKSISQNLEFIADAEATKQIADKKIYQKTLLKITVQPQCIAITNHFYQSLIKKRIVMLNKQQSKKRNSWKYAVILPALAAFMLLFQVKVVAQVKEGAKTTANKVTAEYVSWSVEIHKDATDEELQKETGIFKEEFDAEISVQNVTRNPKKEITGIKVTAKDKTQSKVYEVSGTEPISPFTIKIEKDGADKNSISFNTPRKSLTARTLSYHRDEDSVSNTNPGLRGYGNKMPPMPPMPPIPHMPPSPSEPGTPGGHWSVNTMKIGGDDMLVVINGVKQEKGESIRLSLDEEIAELKVLKDKEGKKKYGKDGKKGVVEITTKKTVPMAYRGRGNMTINDIDIRTLIDDNLSYFEDIMSDREIAGNFRALENVMSGDEMKRLQADLAKSQSELEKMWPEVEEQLQKGLSGREYEESMRDMRREMIEARKELQQARREIMESRNEEWRSNKETRDSKIEKEKAKQAKARTEMSKKA